MAERKQAMNLTVAQPLAEAFYETCRMYGHGKQKGMILSAAILMFLEADAKVQGAYIKAVSAAEIDMGVKRMASCQGADVSRMRPHIAAKKAGQSIHALYELPGEDGQKKRKRSGRKD